MEIKHNYSCSKQVVYKKIDSFLDQLTNQYSDIISNPTKKWNNSNDKMDFSFKVKGFNITGNIKLDTNKLTLEGSLPFLARPFSGKIEDTIKSELEKLF
jgi:hypothetical protein